jgi:pantoate--beta-alanine ligase
MNVVHTIDQARKARRELGSVALVPTMGALHAGHLSLIHEAKKRADHVAVSIFVNPTQFGPKEDYTKYPRPLEADLEKCKSAGVSLVFNPSIEEMYPPEKLAKPDQTSSPSTSRPEPQSTIPTIIIDLPELTSVLEGKHRPNHFKGVCQIVAKLFNILSPNHALFGQKDFQQLRVLTAMTEALNWPVQIIACPTLREPDGLALSSRNQYLSPDERQRALAIPNALFAAQKEVEQGFKQCNRLVATMQKILLDVGSLGRIPVSIDYVAAVDPLTLKPADALDRPIVLAVAARVGLTRLIDNTIVKPNAT